MGRIYAGWALSQTFYRREMWRGLGFKDLEDFLVRSWEASFLRRNAADLLAQLWTWQAGDISANDLYRGDLPMALAGIKAKVLLMPSATDLYFQTDDNRGELPHLKSAKLAEIPSIWGHRAGNPLQQRRARNRNRSAFEIGRTRRNRRIGGCCANATGLAALELFQHGRGCRDVATLTDDIRDRRHHHEQQHGDQRGIDRHRHDRRARNDFFR